MIFNLFFNNLVCLRRPDVNKLTTDLPSIFRNDVLSLKLLFGKENLYFLALKFECFPTSPYIALLIKEINIV